MNSAPARPSVPVQTEARPRLATTTKLTAKGPPAFPTSPISRQTQGIRSLRRRRESAPKPARSLPEAVADARQHGYQSVPVHLGGCRKDQEPDRQREQTWHACPFLPQRSMM